MTKVKKLMVKKEKRIKSDKGSAGVLISEENGVLHFKPMDQFKPEIEELEQLEIIIEEKHEELEKLRERRRYLRIFVGSVKRCYKCKEIKNKKKEFYKDKHVRDGFSRTCIKCTNILYNERQNKHKTSPRILSIDAVARFLYTTLVEFKDGNTRNKLVKKTRIPRTTVFDHLKRMVQYGLVRKEVKNINVVGRQPVIWSVIYPIVDVKNFDFNNIFAFGDKKNSPGEF